MSDSIFLTDGNGTLIGLVDRSYTGELVIPEYVAGEKITAIGYEAFAECRNLTSITIPNSVINIGEAAFVDCTRLTNIVIPNSVTSIGDDAFYGSGLTSINIPNSITSISIGAFGYCENLTSIAIPNSVTNIGDYAFKNCYSLTTIYVPDPDNLSPAVSSYNWPDGITFVKGKSILEQSIYNAFKRMWKHVNTKFSKKDHTHDDRYYQKSELANISNPNLLDNWYFGNPVNQRGQTKYTAAGYTVDRWKKTTSDGAVTMTAGGITATNEAGAGTLYLSQYLGDFDLRNFDCVFSVLTENGLFLTKQEDAGGSQDETPFGYLRIGWSESANCSFVQIQITQGNTANILAAKLELGEGQTLAHQDADGNWVLNEIPNYAEALAKCQRYFVRIKADGNRYGTIAPGFANSTTLFRFYLAVPCTLRSAPAVVMSGSWGAASDGASYTLTSMSAYARTAGEVTITAATDNNSAITPGNFAHLYTAGDETAYIDLDANL